MRTTKTTFAILVLLAAGTAHAQSKPYKAIGDKIISVVGDHFILQSDIDQSIADFKRQNIDLGPDANCMLIEEAVLSKMLLLQAVTDSIQINEEEVEAELRERISYFKKMDQHPEGMSVEEAILKSGDKIRSAIMESRTITAMRQKLVGNITISPKEVKAFYESMPSDSLSFIASELEVGQIIRYPDPSAEMETYIIGELNNYKKQVESGGTNFEALAKKVSENPDIEYTINRNDKAQWPAALLGASFRLKQGEISNPIRSGPGYFLLQLVGRQGDLATVRVILRVPPVTPTDVRHAIDFLNTISRDLQASRISFNETAAQYSQDPAAVYNGPFLLNDKGSPLLTMDQLDKDAAALLAKMKPGEISPATAYTTNDGRKAARILFLKSRTAPHRLNMKDDYSRIADQALEQKKTQALQRWMLSKLQTFYITIDKSVMARCANLKKLNLPGKEF